MSRWKILNFLTLFRTAFLQLLSASLIKQFRMTFTYPVEVIFPLSSSIVSCFQYLVFEIDNITNCHSRKV